MSAGDYIDGLRQKNRKIFEAKEIKMTPASLEAQIRAAFAAGERNIDPYR